MSMNRDKKIIQGDTPLIGMNITKLRQEHKMRNIDVVTQLQLRGIELNTSTLSKIEHGKANPTTNLLIALSEIFQCDFNSFFQEKEEELKQKEHHNKKI